MSTNPFDDENGPFHVVVNDEGQHSLWPAFAAVPGGWQVTLAAASRQDCLDHIEQNWRDLRPRSLQRAMEQDLEQDPRPNRSTV